MKEYISHYTAAYAWQIPYLESVFAAPLGNSFIKSKRKHITVSEPRARYARPGHSVHLCLTQRPRDSVVVRDGQAVSSPPLLFLELANELHFHQLVLLGLQMCSHPPGNPAASVTTKQELKSFVRKANGLHGYAKAQCALQYIDNSSASIMESLAFMLLALPHRYGGFSLHGASFNTEILLKTEAQSRLRQRRCFVDLFYQKEKIAIEYDSFAHHSSPTEQGKDSLKASALERQGIEVIRLNTIQLYDVGAFEEFAYNLATRLDRRLRIRTTRFASQHSELRALLPKSRVLKEF